MHLLQVSGMCCDAFMKLFHQDKVGAASLATVRVISGLVKSLNYNVRPEVTNQSELQCVSYDVSADLAAPTRC